LIAFLADANIADEVGRLERTATRPVPGRRLVTGLGAIAAAAAVLLLAWPGGPDTLGRHRGPTITAGTTPAQLAPVGSVTEARALSWRAVAGATLYRATLFNAAGSALFEAETTDTIVSLPDSITIVAGQLYLWKVEARTAWGRWASSELTEFRVAPGPLSSRSAATLSVAALASFPTSLPPPDRDSLRVLVRHLSDSALVLAVRARSFEVRDVMGEMLARAAQGTPTAAEEELVLARRLASAHATAWNDRFLVREVDRFTAWPPPRRTAKVLADSTRRAGVAVYGQDGAVAAIAIWRHALSMATTIDDSAGMAAALGNIGAGFEHDNEPDSGTTYLERARTLAKAVGDIRVEANATSEWAGIDEERGDIASARRSYARAIELRARIGDSRGLASDYNNLAGLARAAGDLDEARRQLDAALAINRRDNRPEAAATNLVNLAGLATLTGDFSRAEAQYREALGIWRRRQQWADVADALRGLGELETRRGDYPAARTDLLDALVIYDRTGPVAAALMVRQQLSGVRAAAGDLQGALDDLRQAQHLADSAGAEPGTQASLALARADLAAQLNASADAARLYSDAELLYRRAGDREGEAEARQGQGMLFLDQGDPVRAQQLLDAALAAEIATGNRRAASLSHLWLSRVALRRGDTTGARHHLAVATTDLDRIGDKVAAAAAQGERAALELAAGFPAAAASLYRSALSTMKGRTAPEVTWRLHAGLGAVLRDQGTTDAAAVQLRAAIEDIERTGQSLVLAERRSGYLTDKWDVYAQLASLERDLGRVATAFAVSEQMRANEMLELLALGRISAPTDTAADLVAREQDLRRHIGELTGQLERPAAEAQALRGPDLSRAGAVNREALLHAQASYAELLLEMRELAPRHSALVSRETAAWQSVAARLAPDEAFIEYLVSEASALAFVVTRDTVVAFTLGVGRRDLAQSVDFVRGTLTPRGAVGLDSLWRTPLRQLRRNLIAPIETSGLLAGKTRLIIVPHAELHYLPFAALLGGEGRGHYLVERYQVMVTPSASVWLALGARTPDHDTTGVLAFAPQPGALSASLGEVAAISRLGGADTRVVRGTAATEAAFRREAPTRRVIHLATTGVLNKQNPLFSYVEFAPDRGDDGRLEVHEVFGLDLAADLVVLSACQTGLGSGALSDVPAGDDWIGLARAFLSAGAGGVIATLWPVQDRASAALMQQFYKGYAIGGDPGRSLAAAQRALLSEPATASPYYWAGFELVGGR